MAHFILELPDAILNDLKKIDGNATEIFTSMTRAGAEVVEKLVKSSVPLDELRNYVKLSKPYRTPSDGGINMKVYFSGYIPFKGNRKYFSRRGRNGGKVYVTTKGVPADFLAQIYEYGRSDPTFPKKPFFRKSFKKAEIEKAMREAQKKASGGIIDE